MKYYVFRNKSCFHKIKAKNEKEARLLLIVRQNRAFIYFKLVGVFETKFWAKNYIAWNKDKGYINQENFLLENDIK